MTAGNFVVAGADTFVTLVNKFLKSTNNSYFNDSQASLALSETVNKFLFSFGTGMNYKTKKLKKDFGKKFISSVEKIVEKEFMKQTKLFWDSGGFQIAMGALKPETVPTFIDLYYSCVKDYSDLFSHAFILDAPPGPGSKDIFSSYEEIEDLNRKSYHTCKNLPDQIKNKMIYIHHFRTQSLFKTWNKFLFDEGLADGYNYFGTGGLVANMSSDITIPIIIYSIPLTTVLAYVKSKNIKKFKFHVLGGANFLDILYHKMFSYHIKQVHDIDVEITFDSSVLFKGLAIGRFIHILDDNGNLIKMNLRSKALNLRIDDKGSTIRDKTYELVNNLSRFGFSKLNLDKDPIYDQERNTFSRSMTIYLFFYILEIYRHMEHICEQKVKELYPYYESGDTLYFDQKCKEFTKTINKGKLTRKQKAKTQGLRKSLDLITSLDVDACQHFVKIHMDSDDIATLGDNGFLNWEV